MHRRALGLRKEALGREYADILTSLNNLENVLRVYAPEKPQLAPLEKRSHQRLEQLRLNNLQDNVKEIKLDIAAIEAPI